MTDQHVALRVLPLAAVLAHLGVATEWRSRKGGSELYGPCPMHEAKTNRGSFSFHADGRFQCFSCKKKGRGAIDLCMAVKNIGFQAAVELLTPLVGRVEPEPLPASREPEITENKPFKATYEKFYRPHAWLAERRLNPETLERYEVGYYENKTRRSVYNGSVMLKIRRFRDGECMAYVSRNIGEITPENPKYRFPAGFKKSLELWGAWQLKEQARLRVVYVVESAFSVMHFHQLGFPAVALLGWSVSAAQLDILPQLTRGVIYLPDANVRSEAENYAGLLATKLWVKLPEMPVADPEQLTAEQIRALS